MTFGTFPHVLKGLKMFTNKFESDRNVRDEKVHYNLKNCIFCIGVPVQASCCTGTASSRFSSCVAAGLFWSIHILYSSLSSQLDPWTPLDGAGAQRKVRTVAGGIDTVSTTLLYSTVEAGTSI
uniref:Uncharacterized protein n=1 Tax=Ananas comosus var. bracteatus TaxID=296719 RepID=A0A6V7PM31_ANACO|nr:unnamed protein product [Ananas comosus var. bracteatus]